MPDEQQLKHVLPLGTDQTRRRVLVWTVFAWFTTTLRASIDVERSEGIEPWLLLAACHVEVRYVDAPQRRSGYLRVPNHFTFPGDRTKRHGAHVQAVLLDGECPSLNDSWQDLAWLQS